MPTVPYQPYPDQNVPDIPLKPNVQGEAFGVGAGRALAGFGQQVEGAGDKLWNRAVALKQLDNETEAKEADIQYSKEAGLIHANYNALQGKDRVDAFPKYQQDLEDTYRKIRGNISNQSAQRMFDGTAVSVLNRSIFNGAGAAAAAHKEWVVGTAVDQMNIDAKSVEDDPSAATFEQKLSQTRKNAADVAAAKGFDIGGPQHKWLEQQAVSRLVKQRIVGAAYKDPVDADDMLSKYKTMMTPDDLQAVENTVRNQSRAVGSVNLANETYAANKDKTLEEQEAIIRGKAQQQKPDDPLYEQHAVAALKGLYRGTKYDQQQQVLTDKQTVAGGIMENVKNERELRANPEVAAAIDRLPKTDRLDIPNRINRYNAARDKVTQEDTYFQLKGMASSDAKAFMELDVTKFPLAKSDMDKLMNLQQKLAKNPQDDPRVMTALRTLRGSMGTELEALGIYNRTQKNKDDYDKYVGMVQQALEVWQNVKGKPPTYEELTKQIGPQVIEQHTEPTFIGRFFGTQLPFGTSKQPAFNTPVPQEWSDNLKAKIIGEGGVEPADEQIFKAWQRQQFIKLYGKKQSE